MPRMTAVGPLAVLAAVALGPVLLALGAAGPALAHGAPTDPVSRVYACSPEGGAASRTAACRAAVAANGGPFTAWDNLRVANVDGRDRQVVPDGELCSGGLSGYRGLDLARRDWPATRLTPGGTLRMRYASTIPHTGTFRLYLTEPGYDPTKPLTWDDLPRRPFAEITDPALSDGAYHLTAKLPADRTGRQVLYTVWQNTSTPDTYYSCADVVFPQARAASPTTGAGTPSARSGGSGAQASPVRSPDATDRKATGAATAPGTTSPSPAGALAERPAAGSTPVAATSRETGGGPSAPLLAGGAAAVLVLTGGAALAARLRRR
ncbi:lytic polysaccharide monooxygenase [Streptomyces longwoodensis]|uniref:lytic polysaccharide monooxygenase n=1 Tax=Streptomyces longwoodensis TaxID=68231 RepID=UPI002DD9A181|nr:lytic polysaccharide monooxygenase [Streptomyces longwoodensis]WRY91258.1 lytic polysaccharide monooxygenase [Streptomyces longwoodensis]